MGNMQIQQITSRKNPLILHVRRLLTDRKYRRQEKQFVCDGVKLLTEALHWNADIDTVLFSGQALAASIPSHVKIAQIPQDVMESISPMKAPQGILFICKQTETTLPETLEKGNWMILDSLQDPGNIGTIWRCADALQASGIILTGDCVDPFNHKTVRASMGAAFRLPIYEAEIAQIVSSLEKNEIPLRAAALDKSSRSIHEVNLAGSALVIGNEGKGVSPHVLSFCKEMVVIPMHAHCESLNAATAATIFLWEMTKDASKKGG